MLIDSHCHLNFPSFQDDLDDVVERADAAGVKMLTSICTKLDEVLELENLAQKYPQLVYTVGVHPSEVQHHKDLSVEELLALTQKTKVVGLGETGLDFFHNRDYEKLQKQLFCIHIEVARQTGLPVVIHSRAADDEMSQILTEEMAKGKFPALMHCFTASTSLAQTALNLGLYISLSGIITFKNAQELRETLKIIPNDRLLVETDAPYLAPEPNRGKRNEPSFVAHTARYLAELKSITTQQMIEITGNNYFNLFKKAKNYKPTT